MWSAAGVSRRCGPYGGTRFGCVSRGRAACGTGGKIITRKSISVCNGYLFTCRARAEVEDGERGPEKTAREVLGLASERLRLPTMSLKLGLMERKIRKTIMNMTITVIVS